MVRRIAVDCVKAVLTPSQLGAFEYYFRPQLARRFGGPLNGSTNRAEFFHEYLKMRPTSAIVETGTYTGATTKFFAESELPVYSAESSPRYFAYAKRALRKRSNVRLFLGDSRSFLKDLLRDPSVPKSNVFFYLDAHWYADLPLREELDVIFSHWKEATVMIDDFQVPSDAGYQYDDYGPDKALTLSYIDPVSHLGFRSFFPVMPASEEKFLKRGWVVLAKDPAALAALCRLKRVKEWT
jgi:hypothetical protein